MSLYSAYAFSSGCYDFDQTVSKTAMRYSDPAVGVADDECQTM